MFCSRAYANAAVKRPGRNMGRNIKDSLKVSPKREIFMGAKSI